MQLVEHIGYSVVIKREGVKVFSAQRSNLIRVWK